MNLLERTKLTAKKRGFSLSETAVKAGLAEKSIYSWDRSNPKADNLEKVANVLNVSTDYLLGRTDVMNISPKSLIVTLERFKKTGMPLNGRSCFLFYLRKH